MRLTPRAPCLWRGELQVRVAHFLRRYVRTPVGRTYALPLVVSFVRLLQPQGVRLDRVGFWDLIGNSFAVHLAPVDLLGVRMEGVGGATPLAW